MNMRNYCKLIVGISIFAVSGCVVLSKDGATLAQSQFSSGLSVVDVNAVEDGVESPYTETTSADDAYFGVPGQPAVYSSLQGAYKGRALTKHIGDYVKNLTQDLISNMDYVTQKTPVGVTHFALLDSDLQKTNLLGRQMAESFVHEMHKFKIPVIDFKTTEYIRITGEGDFLLSRDYLELKNATSVDYVLTGTLAKHQGGYLVNARLVGMRSRAVVATAQTLVPFYVVDALIPSQHADSNMADGVRLSRGGEE